MLCMVSMWFTMSSCGGNSAPIHGGPIIAGQAQGVYVGTFTGGDAFGALVLPNDNFYAVYGISSGNTASTGVLAGIGVESNSSFSGNLTDFSNSGTIASGSFSSTFTAGAGINGSISEPGKSLTFTFTGAVPPASTFNYNTAAQLSSITGVWTGAIMEGETTTVSVHSTGDFVGATEFACNFSGTAKPDGSGKNFFDVTLTFSGAPCIAAGQTVSGFAIDLASNGTAPHLIVVVKNADNTYATAFVGLLGISSTLGMAEPPNSH
jgi:hypothetical protein